MATQPLTKMSTRNLPGGVKGGRRVSRLSRYCGTLNVSQPYGPPWPGTGIAFTKIVESNRLRIGCEFAVATYSFIYMALQPFVGP
jgi:hypothetical protein